MATGRADVAGIAESRVQGPLDTELGVLKVTTASGPPVALVWNYAIHGTALSRENFLLSGDLMADASLRLERALGVPALFVNGAVGDVSPRPRGWIGVATAGSALAAGALSAWTAAREERGPRLEVVTERVTLPSPALSDAELSGGVDSIECPARTGGRPAVHRRAHRAGAGRDGVGDDPRRARNAARARREGGDAGSASPTSSSPDSPMTISDTS